MVVDTSDYRVDSFFFSRKNFRSNVNVMLREVRCSSGMNRSASGRICCVIYTQLIDVQVMKCYLGSRAVEVISRSNVELSLYQLVASLLCDFFLMTAILRVRLEAT